MLYKKYIKKLKTCPFCKLKENEILKQNKHAVLTLAKAPYTKDHLLVVPKKHVLRLGYLTKEQKYAIEELEYYGLKKLHKKYKNISILYREGDKKQVGKSVDHMHIHLIPNMIIGSKDINNNKRKIYSEGQYARRIAHVKKEFTKA